MDFAASAGHPAGMVDRLLQATNAHDIEALVDCFSPAYRNETPAHPARGFQGQAQVRRNWEQIFAMVPDVTASVLRRSVAEDEVCSEWRCGGRAATGPRT